MRDEGSAAVHVLDALRPRPPATNVDDSEIELADRFVMDNVDKYRSVPGIGIVEWDGTRWQRDLRLRHFDDVRKYCKSRGVLTDSGSESKGDSEIPTCFVIVARLRYVEWLRLQAEVR